MLEACGAFHISLPLAIYTLVGGVIVSPGTITLMVIELFWLSAWLMDTVSMSKGISMPSSASSL